MRDTSKANDELSYTVNRIGLESTPVICVDNWADNAHELQGVPPQDIAHWVAPTTLFPGSWARPPENYTDNLIQRLSELIRSVFGLNGKPHHVFSCYAAITTPPDQLVEYQTVPHVDEIKGAQLATLHYLCGPEHGGTAFFRHKSTGYETLNESRWKTYKDVLDQELLLHQADAPSYPDSGDELFNIIKEYPASYNRLLIYPSNLLHSGLVRSALDFSKPADSRRLTITSFISYF